MYETGQAVFAQVGHTCYLCRVQDVDENGVLFVTDVHFVSRKGDTEEAEILFHNTGLTAPGCEVIYRGPAEARIPASAFTSMWPHELPNAHVKAGEIQR